MLPPSSSTGPARSSEPEPEDGPNLLVRGGPVLLFVLLMGGTMWAHRRRP
ncbi:hypothetical protein [Luteococcus peritonei]|uniref:PEP-CTERM sorting domain-containing protein n=1 Tax=Luteococcus peritonei TaxID=88874 RepID=A0ABW4RU23_9ACTN